MKKFAVHYTGDYIGDRNGCTSREAPTVTEYATLESIPIADRWPFDWMLEHGEVCISSGAYVYQIRKA